MSECQCYICETAGEARHLPLYVCGSEGIVLCRNCEMALITHVRDTRMAVNFALKARHKRFLDAPAAAATPARTGPDGKGEAAPQQHGPDAP